MSSKFIFPGVSLARRVRLLTPFMESAYSVTRLSIAYMVAAHARTPTHTNTHTTINDYSSGIQGWIVGANVDHWGWSLNDPCVHPFSPGQDCCTQPSDHMCTTVYRYRCYFCPL